MSELALVARRTIITLVKDGKLRQDQNIVRLDSLSGIEKETENGWVLEPLSYEVSSVLVNMLGLTRGQLDDGLCITFGNIRVRSFIQEEICASSSGWLRLKLNEFGCIVVSGHQQRLSDGEIVNVPTLQGTPIILAGKIYLAMTDLTLGSPATIPPLPTAENALARQVLKDICGWYLSALEKHMKSAEATDDSCFRERGCQILGWHVGTEEKFLFGAAFTDSAVPGEKKPCVLHRGL